MNRIVVVHKHEFGETSYVVETDMTEYQLMSNDERLAELLELDFEPNKGEKLWSIVIDDACKTILKADW